MLQYIHVCFRREKTFSIVEFPISKSYTQSVVRPLETALVPALACLERTSCYCVKKSSRVFFKQNKLKLLSIILLRQE